MKEYKAGDRVGAILSADNQKVRFFGYGVYQGLGTPPAGTGGLGELLHEMGRNNPKILLDSGETVWGCECWWGPEDSIRKTIGDRSVVMVDPSAVREMLP